MRQRSILNNEIPNSVQWAKTHIDKFNSRYASKNTHNNQNQNDEKEESPGFIAILLKFLAQIVLHGFLKTHGIALPELERAMSGRRETKAQTLEREKIREAFEKIPPAPQRSVLSLIQEPYFNANENPYLKDKDKEKEKVEQTQAKTQTKTKTKTKAPTRQKDAENER